MSEERILQNEALFQRPASPQPASLEEVAIEPFEVIRLALASTEAANQRFPGYRLARLIVARLDLDEADTGACPYRAPVSPVGQSRTSIHQAMRSLG
jgi:hypothetical protein